jgi:NAD-dependent DNA ligase
MTTPFDTDGQPLPQFRSKARQDRTIDELVGICKGLVADGQVCEREVSFLTTWMNENAYQAADRWPMTVLLDRMERMLSDGVIDTSERQELFEVLSQIVGGKPVADRVASFSSTLELNTPELICFEKKTFCFTGKFAFGTRTNCETEVRRRGADILPGVSRGLDYLVVGLMGSRDWLHSSFGNKMEKAFSYREKYGVLIVGEDHWAKFL